MTASQHMLPQAPQRMETYGTINAGPRKPQPLRPLQKPPKTPSPPPPASIYRSPIPRRPLVRKKSSVEFSVCVEINDAESSRRGECRRLSLVEKEELYKVRPDLAIEPPRSIQELDKDRLENQRRFVISMFVSFACMLLLMMFYAVIAMKKPPAP
ncbi:hypothetical protein SDRG_01187 [Saprolegnia diclina VS20]|uniref:Uncharacterized protein n=1 Tax=Saprolegnia diclina (strain VS20) TaxID=1156394 RepID=T0R2M5_SAPDV|nr:hypothetical protein SDRG_01187 [Saprolegnia diclina VS20]EQC41211.1 hypothetical protein SDRG_01187 [Saprolegnia diclina VS20]|eukprot:XP_008604925.1 hypothetical protein SDRG_01187 [Saprolegnia diclina VS20]